MSDDAPVSPAACAGCGKVPKPTPFHHGNTDGRVAATIAPGRTVRVCMAARSRYGLDAVDGCVAKARAKSHHCRACGAEPGATWRGPTFDGQVEVCQECRVMLDRGRAAATAAPKAWYAINTDHLVPYFADSRHGELETLQTLASALAETLSDGRTEMPDGAEAAGIVPALRASRGGFDEGHRLHDARYAELTSKQFAHAQTLVAALRTALGQAWANGQRAGRSILASLASGELTTRELDDRLVKAAETETEIEKGTYR